MNRNSDPEHVLQQGSVLGKERERPGLTVAAALCSSALGAGRGSPAAGAEPGAATPGTRDRVVLPVSWDPAPSRGHLPQPQTHSPARQEEGDSVRRCQGMCPLHKGLLALIAPCREPTPWQNGLCSPCSRRDNVHPKTGQNLILGLRSDNQVGADRILPTASLPCPGCQSPQLPPASTTAR